MTLFSSFYRRFVADAAVSAIVGTKVWENQSPDGVYPCVVIQTTLEADPAIEKRPADHYTVEIMAVAYTPESLTALVTAINALVPRKTWISGNVTVASVSSPQEQRSADVESGSVIYHTSTLTYEVIAVV